MKFSYAIVTIGHARIAFSYKKKRFIEIKQVLHWHSKQLEYYTILMKQFFHETIFMRKFS